VLESITLTMTAVCLLLNWPNNKLFMLVVVGANTLYALLLHL
jgi:hypothetical protein